jgi:effector-binding domain-containing protein
MATESPKYTIIDKENRIETRQYAPYITASVTVVADDYNQAGNRGFNALADYIFGNNTGHSSIAMTAPVIEEKSSSEKIAMTAPVAVARSEPTTYVVAFTMPAKYTLETLPKPNNPEIKLQEMPAHKAAVIRFSGFLNEQALENRVRELQQYISKKGLAPAGPFELLRYDAPWTPWFMRRNEFAITVNG